MCRARLRRLHRASRELFRVFRLFSPVVEGLSLEEAFLDVRGLERILGTPRQIAGDLRREVGRRVGLPITVVLRLRHRDFTRVSRSRTMHRSTATTRTVLTVARSLLAEAMPAIERRGLTLIGIAVSNLDATPGIQLELPLEPPHRPAVDLALDELRERFGKDALSRAAALPPRRRTSLDPEAP